uniref:Uncharacterized protein n=1 Tax=Moorena producens (strain JHB) TaxID=1454205 RepID=A0A1D9FY28_MOOP1
MGWSSHQKMTLRGQLSALSSQLIAISFSYQLSAISYQLSAISHQPSAYELWASYTEQLLNKRCRGATRGEFNYGSNAPLRSWGGSAVLGRQRGLGGFPHERLPWFPP